MDLNNIGATLNDTPILKNPFYFQAFTSGFFLCCLLLLEKPDLIKNYYKVSHLNWWHSAILVGAIVLITFVIGRLLTLVGGLIFSMLFYLLRIKTMLLIEFLEAPSGIFQSIHNYFRIPPLKKRLLNYIHDTSPYLSSFKLPSQEELELRVIDADIDLFRERHPEARETVQRFELGGSFLRSCLTTSVICALYSSPYYWIAAGVIIIFLAPDDFRHRVYLQKKDAEGVIRERTAR